MKPLILLVGKSGVGKTTVAEELEKRYNLHPVESYTTRKPRYKGEKGHTFVSVKEMPPREEMAAYNFFDKNHYWCTFEQLKTSDVYVIDPAGVRDLKGRYNLKKPLVAINLTVPDEVYLQRMLNRGDSLIKASERVHHDAEAFAGFKGDYEIENLDLDKTVERIFEIYNLFE